MCLQEKVISVAYDIPSRNTIPEYVCGRERERGGRERERERERMNLCCESIGLDIGSEFFPLALTPEELTVLILHMHIERTIDRFKLVLLFEIIKLICC